MSPPWEVSHSVAAARRRTAPDRIAGTGRPQALRDPRVARAGVTTSGADRRSVGRAVPVAGCYGCSSDGSSAVSASTSA